MLGWKPYLIQVKFSLQCGSSYTSPMFQPHHRQQWEWCSSFLVWLAGARVGNNDLVLQISELVFKLQILFMVTEVQGERLATIVSISTE